MMTHAQADERLALAAMITEALHLADALRLDLVGISLNGALERLTGHGLAPDATDASIH